MARIVVLGSGPVGRTVAEHFADEGHRVAVVTRSGSGPTRQEVERVALDVGDTEALTRATAGADAVVNAINLPYHQWTERWPGLNRSVLRAAERNEAVLTLVGSFYGYDPTVQPMTPASPLRPPSRKGAVRAAMWAELLEASRQGRLRVLEVRASDYVGPQALTTPNAHGGRRLVDPVLAGRRVPVVGDPDVDHTWTNVDDFARTVVRLTLDERAWGRGWHAPSVPARSIRQLARDVATAAGAPEPRLVSLPGPLLAVAGLFDRQLREVGELRHQFTRPFVDDSSETTDVFGLAPTPWSTTVEQTVAAARRPVAAPVG